MLSSGSFDTRGAVGVEGWPTGGVDIGGGTDARGTYEYGGHTEHHKHELPGSLYSSGKRVPSKPAKQGYGKRRTGYER